MQLTSSHTIPSSFLVIYLNMSPIPSKKKYQNNKSGFFRTPFLTEQCNTNETIAEQMTQQKKESEFLVSYNVYHKKGKTEAPLDINNKTIYLYLTNNITSWYYKRMIQYNLGRMVAWSLLICLVKWKNCICLVLCDFLDINLRTFRKIWKYGTI